MDPSAGTKIKRSAAVTVTLAKHAESTADTDDGSGQSTNMQDDTDDHGSNDSQTPAAQETPEPVPTIVPEPTPAQPSQLPESTTDSQAQVSGESAVQ
ncbi:MAG: hypothetical protein PUF68_09010 [Lactimicrobium massiliense]|nr:hypothetical protein [Lactimicrobium massiliense]MDD6458877.1 hypothetical protein [Lactimicrobium massiliense]